MDQYAILSMPMDYVRILLADLQPGEDSARFPKSRSAQLL